VLQSLLESKAAVEGEARLPSELELGATIVQCHGCGRIGAHEVNPTNQCVQRDHSIGQLRTVRSESEALLRTVRTHCEYSSRTYELDHSIP
jgi:hypothetical protein